MRVSFYISNKLSEEKIINDFKKILDFTIDNENPDYVLSCGGDGTFLDATNKFGCKPIYIPINMGNLGFYSSWCSDSYSQMLKEIKEQRHMSVRTLNIKITYVDYEEEFSCLNEATIFNPINTQILDIYVDDVMLEKFRGTGVCISTPTGSTAYNKSLGGAIISSDKDLFQLTHIAEINNVKYRSLGNSIILGKNETLTFKSSFENFENTVLSIDRKTVKIKNCEEVNITIGEDQVKILIPQNNNFYKRVHDAFIGE